MLLEPWIQISCVNISSKLFSRIPKRLLGFYRSALCQNGWWLPIPIVTFLHIDESKGLCDIQPLCRTSLHQCVFEFANCLINRLHGGSLHDHS